MSREYYIEQITKLEYDFYRMGEDSLEILSRSLKALVDKDTGLAQEIIRKSEEMADKEIELENKCIELLALQQPMAGDLRMIGTILKVLTDCRRFSRLAFDIGVITIRIGKEPLLPEINDICEMYKNVHAMIKDSFIAFKTRDVALAKSLSARDDIVDAQFDRIRRDLIKEMIKDPSTIDMASHLSFVARYLERAADHSCSIASRTVYMVTGERVLIR